MNAKEKLARMEAIEMALWLSPIPEIKSKLDPGLKVFAQGDFDQGVGNQFGTDGSTLPDLGPLHSLGNWLSVGAVIDRKVQQLSNLDPTIKNFDEIIWQNYAHKFTTMPFLLSKITQYREVNISSLSLSKTIEAVEDMIQAVATENTFNAIITSFKKIAQLAVENKGMTQKDNFQQQGILSVKSSLLNVGYLRTQVEMTYKSGKGYEQLTQKIRIDNFSGVLDFDKCKREASTLLGWDGSDVDEWAKETSSQPFSPNTSPAWKN